jgi:hypothetical protein
MSLKRNTTNEIEPKVKGKHKPRRASFELLLDTQVHAISIAQACEILDIARSTASHAIRQTGVLVEGVPVMRVGKRQMVSTTHLREVLGLPQPLRLFDES